MNLLCIRSVLGFEGSILNGSSFFIHLSIHPMFSARKGERDGFILKVFLNRVVI